MMSRLLVGLVLVAAAWIPSAPAAADDRVGFAEEFDSADGWKLDSDDAPFREIKVVDGRLVLGTWVGSFGGAKPPEQEKAFTATASLVKHYEQEVDLDKFHYLVMKTDEKPMFSLLYLFFGKDKKETQVFHTSGLIVQDLTQLGVKGKHKIGFELEVMNTGRDAKIDSIRLVSSLTDEEKAGLVPPPVRLWKEGVGRQLYQRLDALNARAARPAVTPYPDVRFVYHDVGTGVPVWRMTSSPGDEGFSEHFDCWRPDGKGWFARNDYFNFEKQAFDRAPKNPLDRKYDLQFWVGAGQKDVNYRRWDADKGDWEVLYTGTGGNGAIGGDKLCVKSAGTLTVLNAAELDPAKRIKQFTVPYPDSKGNGITPDGKYFTYFGPWGTYQKILVNTDTGEVSKGCQFTFTHGMNGNPLSIMSYGSNSKLVVPDSTALGNPKPGKNLVLYGPYLDPVVTDYGIMTIDGRYGFSNGIGGELAAQHVMFDRADPGTILRLCTYHVSKINWAIWTKSQPSPDYTKLIFITDMLGDGDYHMAVIRLPDPPKALAAARSGKEVSLTWQKPERANELLGYNVYRATASGGTYARINKEVVASTAYADKDAPEGAAFYLVAAQEHSGLEGRFSSEVRLGTEGPVRLHCEAEDATRTRPMRDVVDATASGLWAARITKVAEGEDAGRIAFSVGVPKDGLYWVWARVRGWNEKAAGKFDLVDTKASLDVKHGPWAWVKSSGQIHRTGTNSGLSLSSSVDGLAVDKIVVTDDGAYQPAGADDRTAAPVAVKGLKVAEAKPNSIALAWDASPEPGVYYYSVYSGDKPEFEIGNESVIWSGMKTGMIDWGIKSGAKHYYRSSPSIAAGTCRSRRASRRRQPPWMSPRQNCPRPRRSWATVSRPTRTRTSSTSADMARSRSSSTSPPTAPTTSGPSTVPTRSPGSWCPCRSTASPPSGTAASPSAWAATCPRRPERSVGSWTASRPTIARARSGWTSRRASTRSR